MKKTNNRWQSVLLSLALFGLAACTGDFEDINRNPNQVTDDQMDALNYKTGTKFKALQSLVIPVQEHMYQFNESLSGGPFGGYIGATVDTWQTKFETYNPSADWRKWPFANVITETYTPYKGIVNGTEDEVAIAFARLLRVAIMHRVTDSYGPIPYSKLESNESVYVEYDSQEAVYTKMFEELDEAIEILGRNTTLPAEAWSRYDGVYYGNIAQWLKYANSLKLRMAMRLSYVKSDVARAKAAEAIAGGVPYAGKITLAGRNIRAFRASELARRIGVLAQKNAVSYAYSVEEVVSLGRYAHASGFLASRDDDGGERVERALELTGLTELRRASVLTLSGGELQRTFLAQVVADSHSRRTGEPPRSDLSEAHLFAD